MNNIIIHDTLECFINDENKVFFFGLTDQGQVSQTVTQNVIRSGIGAKVAAVLQSEKNIEFTVTTTFHNDDILAIQSGTDFTTGSVTIQRTESGKLAAGKLTIEGTPKGDTVIVMDKTGKTFTSTYLAGEVTVTGGVDGQIYTVIYSEDVANAQILDLDATEYPKNASVQLHGIGYDPDTNEVVCDIYWLFDKVLPNGAFTFTGRKGNDQSTNEMTFAAQTLIGSNSYGKYVVIPRA